MRMSMEGLAKLTKPWEEFVAFPYDDKVPPRIVSGRREYVEWDGGPLRGTLTIGYGHTDAAGEPKIKAGMRLTESEACAVLDRDIAPCERMVSAALKVEVTQHQFDALVDLTFNCPSALKHVASLVNAGNWPGAERVLLQYVNSKGERMVGLVHRRNAEIAWANTPDAVTSVALPTAAASPAPEIISPKAEQAPPPKPITQSKTAAASITVAAGGVVAAVQAANEAAAPIKELKQNLADLGVLDQLAALAHSPMLAGAIGIATIALGAFIFIDRRSKLNKDHV
jgi:lysozyme